MKYLFNFPCARAALSISPFDFVECKLANWDFEVNARLASFPSLSITHNSWPINEWKNHINCPAFQVLTYLRCENFEHQMGMVTFSWIMYNSKQFMNMFLYWVLVKKKFDRFGWITIQFFAGKKLYKFYDDTNASYL